MRGKRLAQTVRPMREVHDTTSLDSRDNTVGGGIKQVLSIPPGAREGLDLRLGDASKKSEKLEER